jgi:hypothetical protein
MCPGTKSTRFKSDQENPTSFLVCDELQNANVVVMCPAAPLACLIRLHNALDDLLGPDDDDDDDEFNEDAPFDLPAPNLKNLTAIRAIMLSAVGPFHKERLATAVLKADYIRKLCDVFQIVEDLESRPDLHILFDIFKQLGV